MKVFIIIALTLFLCPKSYSADKWTQQDIQLETIIIALQIIDWGQTHSIIDDPEFEEGNPLLGSNPTSGKVNLFFIATTIIHIGITHILPQKHRKGWQSAFIAVSGAVVLHNNSIGVRIKF